ncbi:MAG: hypothetical protein GY820_44350 [Gammaproteobacteria bacterium]|nr:hypothetical protein [Gammaproteobacteria bacterium]
MSENSKLLEIDQSWYQSMQNHELIPTVVLEPMSNAICSNERLKCSGWPTAH